MRGWSPRRVVEQAVIVVGVLCVLSGSPGGMHAYWLRNGLESLGIRVPESTLRDVLKRLEKAGYIRGEWLRGPQGRLRRVYTLTEEGRSLLEELRGLLAKALCTGGSL